MSERPLDEVLLRRGSTLTFRDRDELLAGLDRLDRRVPSRRERRTQDRREHCCIVRYLQRLAAIGRDLPLPLTVERPVDDPPDFILTWADGRKETFELTEGSAEEYQQRLTAAVRSGASGFVFPAGVDLQTSDEDAEERWVEIMLAAYERKDNQLSLGRMRVDHLLIYDQTGLGLLVPLDEGGTALRARLHQLRHGKANLPIERVSVLRDTSLLADVAGELSQVAQGESPYFQISVISAEDGEDLRRRLRDLDRYCRNHAIRHLKLFGSVLGDRVVNSHDPDERGFDPRRSDVDLLVEFKPAATVTLLDMARMERELGELVGFEVDLRTAGDLGRYFRERVLAEAVEVHAR